MTNPETRKTRQTAASEQQNNQVNGLHAGNELAEVDISAMDAWRRSTDECEYSDEDDSLTQTPDSDDDINDDSDNDEGELSLGTCSSFSLQECIDEFKARRIRRVSQQSRELVVEKHLKGCGQKSNLPDSAEADLINQNRTNKEHERKCKPCKNGFCYCFTSDSGDAVSVAAPGHIVRQHKRNRKSESNQVSYAAQQRHTIPRAKEKRRQSAPPILKEPTSTTTRSGSKIKTASTCQDQMRAVSRLGTADKNAPLIHIIQELRNNCVVSEVRINKHKIQAHRSRSLSSKPSPKKKTHFDLSEELNRNQPKRLSLPPTPLVKTPTPSAPTLDKISELDSLSEPFIYSASLDTSTKSSGSGRRHKAAGLLLQKRLSHAPIQFKPRNLSEPPPKPPRSNGLVNSDTNKASVSTLASTTSSVRQAERVVDDFLRSKGIASPDGVLKKTTKSKEQMISKEQTHSKGKKERANEKAKKQQQEEKEHQIKLNASGDVSHKNKRNSYPLIQPKTKPNVQKTLPTYPSLSEFERLMEKDTRQAAANNEKNTHQATEKHVKQHTFGWKEPEEAESLQQMLNYDANANKRQFRSQAVQAGPQAIGWQIPSKMALDTVDGGLQQNLDANISKKITPVKTHFATSSQQNDSVSQKYLFRKQFKNFMNSPWSNKPPTFATDEKPKSNLKSSSQSFLNNSKKRILRLVSPKKENRERRSEPFRKTPLRSIGIQTSKEEMRSLESSSTPLSPPGSYFSAVQTSQQSTTVTNESQEAPQMNFNFDRTVHSPPKKPKELIRGKLNFSPHLDRTSNGSPDAKTYRSFQSELDQDVTLSKMGLILSNIRAKLEASDDHAVRTFREIGQREQQFAAGLDCIDGEQGVCHQSRSDLQRKQRHFAIDEREEEPIYSEIEEDSIHILSSPNFDNKTANIEHFPAEQDPSALYAKVVKTPKQINNRVTVTEPQQLQQSQKQQQLHQHQEEQNSSKHAQHQQKQQPQHHQKKQQKQEQPHQQQRNQQQVNHGHQQQQIYEQQPKQHKQQQHQPQQHQPQKHQPQQYKQQQHQPQQHKQQQHQPQQHKQQQHQPQQQQHQPQQHKQQHQKQHEQQYYNQLNNQPQKQHQKQQTEQHQIQSQEQQQQHLKQQQLLSPNTRLAKCFQESLKSKIKLKPLPPLKTSTTYAPFHASSSSPSLPSFSHSLNNIRVKEQHSPPKHNRHLSKSDLSLHRSEIFLENLCRSELIINGSSDPLPLEKVSNVNLNESYMSTDSRSEARNLTSQNEDEYVDEVAETAEAGDIDFDDNDDRVTYYTNTDLNHNIETDNYDNYYDDEVSYELPGNEAADLSQNTAGSRYAVNHSRPLTNQSTPKKSQTKPQTFTTKENVDEAELPTKQHQSNSDIQHLQQNPCSSNTELPPQKEQEQQKQGSLDINKPCLLSLPLPQQHLSQSNSCPNTPRRLPPIPPDNESNACTASLIEVTASYTDDTTQPVCCKSTLARYQRLKNAFRMSLRRSKNFVKTESKRLSSSLSFPAAAVAAAVTTGSFSNKSRHNQSQSSASEMLIDSTFNLDFLFALDDDDQPLEQQLAKAVTICRQLPDLEISPEMVEAERLLLFSTLRREAAKWPTIPGTVTAQSYEQQRPQRGCIYVDGMRIPTRTDASQDLFFNYFYICTFYCGGVITSTQSVECRNQEAIFIDCGIEFAALDSEAEVNCEIFMLRLRKVSTISFEYTKKSILNLSRSSMTSSCDDIVSRFRLHGSFTIRPSDFLPYEYVELASKSSGSICLRSSVSCRIAITPRTKSTNLSTEALLTGRADMRFPKFTHRGFLNVQQPENQHHWNRRWCTLDGMFLRVWQDVPLDEEIGDSASQPLLQFYLHLRGETGILESASPELCARPRSFCLDCCVVKSTDDEAESTTTRTTRNVFLAAESQNDLSTWLLKLNEVLDFTAKWMKR